MANPISKVNLVINGVTTQLDIHDANASEFVLVSDLSTVATSGSYNDLSNKPTIPTVNNATLTIQQNGTTVDTFTANSSSDKTVNIQCVDLNSNQTVGGIKTFSNAPVVGSINLDGKTIDTDANGDMTYDGNKVLTNANLPSVLPIGSYIQFAGSQAPAGFLVCNGGEISRTTYSALFAVIGTTYGSGDGSTTFNLPNLTDRFLQGSATSGTVKNAGLPNISGNIISVIRGDYLIGGAFALDGSGGQKIQFSPTSSGGANIIEDASISFSANSYDSIYGNSSTVQPPALTCLICIKY